MLEKILEEREILDEVKEQLEDRREINLQKKTSIIEKRKKEDEKSDIRGVWNKKSKEKIYKLGLSWAKLRLSGAEADF